MSDGDNVLPFDRKKAISEMIEALIKVRHTNKINLNRAEQAMSEAEASVNAYRLMDGYVKGQIQDMVAIKQKIEAEEKEKQG